MTKKFKKSFLPLGITIIFLFFLITPLPANAIVGRIVGGIVSSILNLIFFTVAVPFLIGTFVMSIFAGVSTVLLTAVVSGDIFGGISYTNNEIVRLGLNITQGLVNMALVLILVYIAIATMLRLAGYETKKIFIRFVAIALLVNFAPLVCGIIVDAANLIMYHFIQGTTYGSAFMSRAGAVLSGYFSKVSSWEHWTGGPKAGAEQISILIALIIVYFFAGILYLLFALLFIARYFAIWILVILSPIAFASLILPQTRNIWSQWWNNFIQWSFVGVFGMFFLYLAEKVGQLSLTAKEPGWAPEMQNTIAAFIPVVFLGIGFLFALKSSAMGAGVIMSWIKEKAPSPDLATAKRGFQKTRTALSQTKYGKKTAEFIERSASAPRWGEGQSGFSGWAKRTASTPVRYVRRGMGSVFGEEAIKKSEQQAIKESEELLDKKGVKGDKSLLKEYHDAVSDTERIAVLNKAQKEGELGKMMDGKKNKNALGEDELKRMLNTAKSIGASKEIEKAVPHLASEFISDKELGDAKIKDPKIETKIDVAISRMKSKDFANLSEQALENHDVMESIIKQKTGKDIENLLDAHGMKAAKAIEEALDRARTKTGKATPYDYLETENQPLSKYLLYNAGRGGLIKYDKPSTTPTPTPRPLGGAPIPPSPSPSPTPTPSPSPTPTPTPGTTPPPGGAPPTPPPSPPKTTPPKPKHKRTKP